MFPATCVPATIAICGCTIVSRAFDGEICGSGCTISQPAAMFRTILWHAWQHVHLVMYRSFDDLRMCDSFSIVALAPVSLPAARG
jgi:hypothetical protein